MIKLRRIVTAHAVRHPERSERSPKHGTVPSSWRSLATLGMTCEQLRRILILLTLFAVFITPGIFAYLVYQHPIWLGHTNNHGVLLSPPKQLTAFQAVCADHEVADRSKPKWHLIFWSPDRCDERCMQEMDQLARIRLALGRHLYKLELDLLLLQRQHDLSKSNLKILHEKDTHVLRLPTSNQGDGAILGDEPAIYIINPQHYAILKYTELSQSDDIFHDLQQLVKDK